MASACPVSCSRQQGKVELGNPPPSSPSESGKGRFTSMSMENLLHSLHFHVVIYRRQQSSFSIPGVPKLWELTSAQAENHCQPLFRGQTRRPAPLPCQELLAPVQGLQRPCSSGEEDQTSAMEGFFCRAAVNQRTEEREPVCSASCIQPQQSGKEREIESN